MDNSMGSMAEMAARLLLQEYRGAHPHWIDDRTPIDELVAWLGLQVETFHPNDYATGTYGFIDPDEEENLIWLKRNMQESLHRFTLAHELGHVILHCQHSKHFQTLLQRFAQLAKITGAADLPELSRADPCQQEDVQEDMTRLLDQEKFEETLGIGHSYNPRSQRELEANLFAAEILIPDVRIRALYMTPAISPDTLATTFGVSNTALLNRLAGLLKNPVQAQPEEQMPKTDGTSPPARRYDAFQQAAIEAATPALIVAGPGSGKTSTLIGRTNYLIRVLNYKPQHILALTFSRKAAQEMEERLQQVLEGDGYNLPKVSTFHAFCADLLRQHGTLVGLRKDFALLDDAEGYFLLRYQSNDMHLRHYQKLQSPAYYFPDMLKAISRAKDELISPEEYAILAQRMKETARDEETLQQAEKALEIAHIYALYEKALLQRGDSDFGGLLTLTLQLFRQHPRLLREQQQRYQQILVDEFQDVNRASGVLLRELAGEKQNVWVVGDANQAIYGFRGASPANISQFAQDFPGAIVLPLSLNYRSRPDLVAIAEAFRALQLETGAEAGKNQPVRLTHADTYLTIAQASSEQAELAGIAQDIHFKIANGYTYKDMIVLCRTRAHAQKISRALAAEGIPIVEQGGMLEQEYIKDLLSVLTLLVDTSGMGLLRAARQQEHPLTQSDIEAILLAAREPHSNPRTLLLTDAAPLRMSIEGRHSFTRLSHILQVLRHAPDIWSLLAQYLLVETSLIRSLLSQPDNKQSATRLADYMRLLQLARHYDQQQAIRAKQIEQEETEGEQQPALVHLHEEPVKGFLEYLRLLILLRQDGGSRPTGGEEEENANIIRVMTVHASKGLEFPIVYMPGLVQRKFPLQARAAPVAAPAGMLALENSMTHETGEACLFYVGVTRARDHLVLSYSERYGKVKYKRSLYLDALEKGLAEERITRLFWDFQKLDALSAQAETQSEVTPSQPGKNFIQAMRSPTLSASAIEAYQRCPRQYAYDAIYHFSGDNSSYRLFWQATHKTVEELQKQLHPKKESEQEDKALPTQQELQEIYTQHWQELGGHTAPFATLYEEHGHEVIEAARHDFATRNDISWELRPNIQVEVAGKEVHVTIDRVEASKQANVPTKFVRTRFGKQKEKPAAETRELFYTLAYRQTHPGQQVELHTHNMSTGEMQPITMTQKKEQSLYDNAEQAIKGLENNDYPAQPAEPFRCPICPFFLICPA